MDLHSTPWKPGANLQGTATPHNTHHFQEQTLKLTLGCLCKYLAPEAHLGTQWLCRGPCPVLISLGDIEIGTRRCLISCTSLRGSESSTRNKSEQPFASEAGYYVTGRADSGMQPPLLGNQADSLSAFQQELLLSLPGFARYRGNRLESKGKFFSQTAPASRG